MTIASDAGRVGSSGESVYSACKGGLIALTRELASAEQTRMIEGVSTPYDVIRRQRDLRAAEFAEVQARANYAKALVELGRSTGSLEESR